MQGQADKSNKLHLHKGVFFYNINSMDTTLFWEKVNKTETCWLWQAWHNAYGYGLYRQNKRQILAHRYSYQLVHGEIPAGLVIDHLCKVPACVNPEHLEAVTQAENMRRGLIWQRRREQTHCKWGHSLSGDNLYMRSDGKRACRACKAKVMHKVRIRKKSS